LGFGWRGWWWWWFQGWWWWWLWAYLPLVFLLEYIFIFTLKYREFESDPNSWMFCIFFKNKNYTDLRLESSNGLYLHGTRIKKWDVLLLHAVLYSIESSAFLEKKNGLKQDKSPFIKIYLLQHSHFIRRARKWQKWRTKPTIVLAKWFDILCPSLLYY